MERGDQRNRQVALRIHFASQEKVPIQIVLAEVVFAVKVNELRSFDILK